MGMLDWRRDIRYILVDWGGTLCRNDRETDAIRQGIEGIARRLNIDPAAQASVAASLGKALHEAYLKCDMDPKHRELDARAVMQQWGEEMGFARKRGWDLASMVEDLWRYWQGCAELLGEPLPALRELRERGFVLALLSNVAAPAEVCRGELQRLGLLEWFQSCTFSSELGLRKPHRAAFETALRKLGDGKAVAPGSVLYVGDSPRWDVGGAKAAGLRAVLFRSQVSTWPEEDYQAFPPDAIIDRISELLVLLPRKAAVAANSQARQSG